MLRSGGHEQKTVSPGCVSKGDVLSTAGRGGGCCGHSKRCAVSKSSKSEIGKKDRRTGEKSDSI